MPTTFSALLLAAGRSTRMGRDKAMLELDGAPLWQRQRDMLVRAGAAEVLLSARPEQTWTRAAAPHFAAMVHDSQPNSGPLAGITAGLERASQAHLAVLAIDLPQMTAAWFTALRATCRPGVGAVGRRDGFFEPLAAIYPRELMPLAWAALARGELSLQKLSGTAVANGVMQVCEITASEVPLFENWNEPR
ncbi:MAG: molybdenum cofactor guanylyltransferase [Verrucomicrobia bacterium]|nr:molybdenum cofactor guanylyltransferase [Verrucomicrobiota bacterium]